LVFTSTVKVFCSPSNQPLESSALARGIRPRRSDRFAGTACIAILAGNVEIAITLYGDDSLFDLTGSGS